MSSKAESKCTPSGLADWALTDFSQLYCDMFTVIWMKCGFGWPSALADFPGMHPQKIRPDICAESKCPDVTAPAVGGHLYSGYMREQVSGEGEQVT